MRGAAAVVLVLVLVGATAGPAAADEVSAMDATAMATELNRARQDAGLSGLERRADLDEIAQRHSMRMASAGGGPFHSGDPAGGLSDWERVGEIVGRASLGDPDWVRVLTDAFLASPRHRDELLDVHYLQMGVGVAEVGESVYVTGVFLRPAARPQPAVVAPAPTTPAQPPEPDSRSRPRASRVLAAPARPPAPAAPAPDSAPSDGTLAPGDWPVPEVAVPAPIDLIATSSPVRGDARVPGGPMLAGPKTNLLVALVVGATLVAAVAPVTRSRLTTGR